MELILKYVYACDGVYMQTVESLVGVQLSDDIGEWVADGVVLCKVVNILHPGTIAIIHTPPPGQVLLSNSAHHCD